MAKANTKIAIVGGGLAGLMAAIKICEEGNPVELFSIVPVRRSHSVCAQGGINASVNTKGEGDSPQVHFYETVKGGDFLANQELPKQMCDAAPHIVFMFDRMGVRFNRTPEGNLDFRRFGGTLFHRTAFSGATTGQQLLYALDERVRKFESEGLVKKYEGWLFLSIVKDEEGICRGLVAQNMDTMEVRTFREDAVILATGGMGLVYGRSTNSMICTGDAATAVYQQGAVYANGEFIQIHPTSIPGEDKYRLISEAARGEGGRVWVPRDGKPWYFLEDWYPKYGNLVPRDVASRALWKVVHELKLGVDGGESVYLDLTHIPAAELDKKLEGILEIYEKFMGDDPRKVPMRVYPSVHYTMGGLWIDDTHMTSVPGLLAAGECDYQYHGANRLGANSLLSSVYGGMVAGPSALKYAKGLKKYCGSVPGAVFEREEARQTHWNQKIAAMDGNENPHKLHDELGDIMTKNVTIVRHNKDLEATDKKLQELKARWHNIKILDNTAWANSELLFVRQLWHMLELARVITLGALARNESRGSHYKPEFPNRDDVNWLKTTKAEWTKDGPKLSYEPVDLKYLTPELRNYA
ncbi:MAG: succinate dehydrogenase flavoprotein subunit [Deltaproteobacteria bacterium CG11_big_fil_rev_8_21_14_0_20_49_13]|nr:MAG: succinate dehydrogenase flavoprotein subunit [Deltaproteobacteria bacterium CG11_big_fil_rev_8_21_14_0_20_49_13]